ncbi:RHS repeat domain-containing protein [Paenibacillus puerhi]|uniref:hypothetical protein n=1 Tax=Paenibacillus puerhi TaxID=2692622 RepID=UPI00135945C4|nr:hypothetical protein [Paenibacillus puerhi]
MSYYPGLTTRLYYKHGEAPVDPKAGSSGDFYFLPKFFVYYYLTSIQYMGSLKYWEFPWTNPKVYEFDNEEYRKLQKTWAKQDPDLPGSSAFMINDSLSFNNTYLTVKAFTNGNVLEEPGSRVAVCRDFKAPNPQYGCLLDNPYLYAYGNKLVDRATEENRFPLGKGWSWDIPFIETKPNNKRYITLFGGETYELVGTSLKGYPWKDLKLEYDNSIVNNMYSQYVLTTLDGTKQYFSSTGKLIQISDAYKNTIQFEYSDIAPYGNVLTKVRDALNNEINITYSTTEVRITQGDRNVTYTKTKDPQQNKELLAQVKDAQGRNTSYVYEIGRVPFDLVGYGKSKDNYVALLKQVYHPTQARTEYAYESFTRSLGDKASETAFRVGSREDIVTYMNGSESKSNHIDYTYMGDGAKVQTTNLTFSTTVKNGRVNTTYTYDKVYIDDTTPEVIYNTQIKQDDGTTQRIQDMEYDRNNRRSVPIKTTSYVKRGAEQSSSLITSRVYDEYGNVVSETNPEQVTTTFTYDDQTHLLRTTQTPMGDGLSIFTEIERNPIYHSVKKASIRENGATGKLLGQAEYSYDAVGNPKTVTLKDDARDIQVVYQYGTAYGQGFPTQQSIETTNADGQKSTIVQNYQYNKQTGQMTTFTDGNRHATTYTYDKLGRMLSIKNPDGTLQTLIYNDSENTVTETDPTNVKVITRWNPLGLKTHTGIEGKSAATYGYDAYGRLEWVEDGAGHRTTYQYDKWGRLIHTLLPGGASSITQYDDVNRTVLETDPEGYSTKQWLDLMGRVVKKESYSPTGVLTSSIQMSYTLAGQVKVVDEGVASEASGITRTQYEYDAMGRVKSVLNGMQEKTAYKYSLAGQLTEVQYPDGNKLTKHYDEMGRLVRRIDPAGQAERYYYDSNSNMSKKIDRNGHATTYLYDNRNFMDNITTTDEVIRSPRMRQEDGYRCKMVLEPHLIPMNQEVAG